MLDQPLMDRDRFLVPVKKHERCGTAGVKIGRILKRRKREIDDAEHPFKLTVAKGASRDTKQNVGLLSFILI